MNEKTTIKVGDKELKLQKPSTEWFIKLTDDAQMGMGKISTLKMIKALLENVVIEPTNLNINDFSISEAMEFQEKASEWLRS